MLSGAARFVGTMSGTSLDGVDVAEIVTDGREVLEIGPGATREYSDEEQAILRTALGRWPGEAGVADAAEVLLRTHAEVLTGFDPDAPVGFHGQTLAHDPGGRGTHQAGDGAELARRSGRTVVWDFRASDVEMGGQGAPIAPFYHHALARFLGFAAPVAFLNLGGVANVSWVDPGQAEPEAPGACLAFDCGPANAPVDDLMRARGGARFDEVGARAATGTVDPEILDQAMAMPFFDAAPPKSLDRDAFALVASAAAALPLSDAAATLTAVSAAGVVRALDHLPGRPQAWIVCGGGRRNATLMAMIAAGSGIPATPVDDFGVDGDLIEAQAMAFLAARVLAGLPTTAPGTTGVAAPLGGGVVSRAGPAELSSP